MAETATIPVEEAGAYAPASETPNPEQANPQGGDQRPDWLPEKFKTAEQMAQAYSELERKLSGGAEEKAPEETPEAETKTDDETEEKPEDKTEEVTYGKAVDSALEGVGLKPADIWQEFQDNQGLTDETYTKLENAGYPRSVVDGYIGNAQAERQRSDAEYADIRQIAGGDEGYTDMVAWAKDNLTPEQAQSYNAMVTSGDTWQAKAAVQALHAQYSQAEGKEPKLTMGGSQPKADAFASAVEASRAMGEARKSGDPARIREVEQKMLRSNVFAGR